MSAQTVTPPADTGILLAAHILLEGVFLAALIWLTVWIVREARRRHRPHVPAGVDLAALRSTALDVDQRRIDAELADSLDRNPHLDPNAHLAAGCLFCLGVVDAIQQVVRDQAILDRLEEDFADEH